MVQSTAATPGPPHDDRPPVVIVGGFLGAGKTTLINRLLRSDRMANTALIVNELGDIAIDDDLIEHAGETMVELAGGCVCCSMVGTLAETLISLADADRPPFERVMIETTGLANIGPITNTIIADDALADRYRFDRVITVVDAVNGSSSLDRHPESVEQAAVGDVIVMSKTDLVADRRALDGLEERLRRLNPLAPILIGEDGGADVDAVLGPISLTRLGRATTTTSSIGDGVHDAHIITAVVRREHALSRQQLERAWAEFGEAVGPNLLRVKGLVAVADHRGPAVVHGAQETLSAIEYREAWPSEDHSTRLVFIGWDLDQDQLESLIPGGHGYNPT